VLRDGGKNWSVTGGDISFSLLIATPLPSFYSGIIDSAIVFP
jgi:hypothetical protein